MKLIVSFHLLAKNKQKRSFPLRLTKISETKFCYGSFMRKLRTYCYSSQPSSNLIYVSIAMLISLSLINSFAE